MNILNLDGLLYLFDALDSVDPTNLKLGAVIMAVGLAVVIAVTVWPERQARR
jgi:hypothetical protein